MFSASGIQNSIYVHSIKLLSYIISMFCILSNLFSLLDLTVSEREVLKLPDYDWPCSQFLMVILSILTLYVFEIILLCHVSSGLIYLPGELLFITK